jgi:predicted nucleic acid-binding protein
MSEYIDASVIVKWFKKDELYFYESQVLLQRVISFDTQFIMNSYGILEVVRALVKAKFPREQIHDAFQNLSDLYDIGAIKTVDLDAIIHLAKDVEIDLNLYASDAVHVASSIFQDCSFFWSADNHHTKEKTKEYLKKYDVNVKHISDVKG